MLRARNKIIAQNGAIILFGLFLRIFDYHRSRCFIDDVRRVVILTYRFFVLTYPHFHKKKEVIVLLKR